MEPENKKNESSRKKAILKFSGIALYLVVLLYFYYLLITSGFDPLIISILLVFIILTTVGPFLRPKKRKLYSRMFPDRANLSEQKKEEQVINAKNLEQKELMVPKPINLSFEYRKPIINKCKNCGNIVPNFVKKCPFCNKSII
jgi:hypothetical protein